MRVDLKLALLLSLSVPKIIQASVVGCSAEIDANIWNLNSLRRTQEQNDYQLSLNHGNTTSTLYLNLCSNTYHKCALDSEGKGNGDDDFANIVFPNGTCHRITQDDMDESTAEYIDPKLPEYGIRLTFLSEEQCNENDKYGMTLDIRCDASVTSPLPRLNTDSVQGSICHPRIYIDSPAGCIGQSFSKLWTFCQDLVDEVGVALIFLGIFLTFFGQKYASSTLFIAGTLAGTMISLILFYGLILPDFTPNWGHMVAFFISIVAGLVLGLVCSMFTKLGVFVLGGWLGATGGMMLYNAFLSQLFGSGSKAQTGMLAVIVISIAIGGITMMYLFDHALALGSSVTGSYALLRGLSIFIGGFPNEYLVYLELQNGFYASMPDEFYIYLGFYIVIAITGFVVQEREILCKDRFGKKEKKEDAEEEEKDEEEKPLVKKDKKEKEKKEKKNKK